MSDDGSRPDNLPSVGEQNFTENGSETMENDQTGLPSWASALAAQMQTSFAAQLMQMRAEHERRAADDRAAIRTLLEEYTACSARHSASYHAKDGDRGTAKRKLPSTQ